MKVFLTKFSGFSGLTLSWILQPLNLVSLILLHPPWVIFFPFVVTPNARPDFSKPWFLFYITSLFRTGLSLSISKVEAGPLLVVLIIVARHLSAITIRELRTWDCELKERKQESISSHCQLLKSIKITKTKEGPVFLSSHVPRNVSQTDVFEVDDSYKSTLMSSTILQKKKKSGLQLHPFKIQNHFYNIK